jgi:hypothetical protein
MRVMLLTLACLLALTGFSRARLGETLEECVDRYGPVLEKRQATFSSSDPEVAVFVKASIAVFVEFRKGKAWRITFRKPLISPSEVESLLKANAGEDDWGPPLSVATRIFRQSNDKERMCIISESRPGLPNVVEIVSRDYVDEYHASLLDRAQNPSSIEESRRKLNPLPGF